MLTSRNDVDSIVAAQNDGVDAFITKPVTTDDIQRKIQVLLR
jgi:DNA-binding response OmpR family regulator